MADGTAHRLFIERRQVGLDRTAQGRRRGDQAHLTHPGEAHVERARDRGCREGQDINVFAKNLDLLFLVHAKTLLLIHHQQAQLLKAGALAQQLMGPHHHINRPITEAFENLFALARRAEAIQQRHLDRIRRKAFAQGAPMLLSQHGGWRQ